MESTTLVEFGERVLGTMIGFFLAEWLWSLLSRCKTHVDRVKERFE